MATGVQEDLRFGIVTPSLNQEQFLEEAIRSVLDQGCPTLDYFVIDGGSTDQSTSILERVGPEVTDWVSEPDRGPAEAIQKGWSTTDADVLAYLNADDVYLPGCLSAVASAFEMHPKVVAVCGSQLVIDREGRVLDLKEVAEVSYESLLGLAFIPQPATFVRRWAIEQAGGIDTEQQYIFDFELFLRVFRLGPVAAIPRPLAATRWHADTITQRSLPQIGAALAQVVDRETRRDDRLDRPQATLIRWKANRLACLYHVRSGHPLGAARFLARTLASSPSPRHVIGALTALIREMSEPVNPGNRYEDVSPGPHWREWAGTTASQGPTRSFATTPQPLRKPD